MDVQGGTSRAGDDSATARSRRTLRFVADDLERRFQEAAAAAARRQFRLGLAVGALLWAVGGPLLALFTAVNKTLALGVSAALVASNLAAFRLSRGAATLDAQHAIGTVVNLLAGVAILWLAITAGAAERHLVPALMLISIFAFVVLRLRFVAALAAGVVYLALFAAVAAAHPSPAWLAIDSFLLVSAIGSAIAATYFIESTDRDLFLERERVAASEAALRVEKAKSDRLLRSILPEAIVAELREEERTIAERFDEATVLFADLVGFTPLVERMTPSETAAMLNELYREFDDASRRHGVEKIKTIGDAYMAAAGVPEPCADHATRAVALASEMLEIIRRRGGDDPNAPRLRVGIHSGSVVAGVIGKTKFSYDLWGDTVNVASRLESQGLPGRIQVSEATRSRLGERFRTSPRGEIPLKGHEPILAHWIEPE